MCIAPASYGGACKKMQSFSGTNIAEKQQLAEDCQSPWPCNDDCSEGRDYSDLCPQGWSETDLDGFCEGPPSLATKCATSFNFAEMSTKTRQELARTCGFNWKCQDVCRQDWSKSCPEEWTEVPMNPGFCMAPPTYSGICSFSVNTSRMSSDQKASYARKCAVKFPCLAHGMGSEAAEAAAAAGAGPEANGTDTMPDGPVSLDGRIVTALKSFPVPDKVDMGIASRLTKLFNVPSGPSSMAFLQDQAQI